ncbi:hypothetical protein BH23VER1_BH23VER1_13120 [soil metagenome]
MAISAALTFAVPQQAEAALIQGSITFSGGADLDSDNLGAATQVVAWEDVLVQSASGNFATLVGDSVTTSAPWVFGSGRTDLWMVGGFEFDLVDSTINFQNANFLAVSGTGTISGNGFDPTPGVWNFTTQEPDAMGIFSFSSSTSSLASVPDGGATVALFGLSLLGLQ